FVSCADFVRALRSANSDPVAVPFALAVPTIPQPKTDPLLRPKAAPAVPSGHTDDPQTFGRPARSGVAARGHSGRSGVSDRGREAVLFPALIVGVGGMGLAALRHLRRLIHDRFGRPTLPNLRWLFIDTDAKAAEEALTGDPATALGYDEVLLT